jgi:hypothetical protein
VDIYDGVLLLATLTARQFRQDLIAHTGDGFHGFRYVVPDALRDGKTHSIRVKVSGTEIDLINTPKDINCP